MFYPRIQTYLNTTNLFVQRLILLENIKNLESYILKVDYTFNRAHLIRQAAKELTNQKRLLSGVELKVKEYLKDTIYTLPFSN